LLGYPKSNEQGSAVPDSSGCAVGSDLQDAAIRGFLELVERDAASIWWYNMIRRPAPDAVFLDDPLIKQVFAWCRERGRIVHLIDITHDLRIPVVVAISANDAGREVGLGFGAGANAMAAVRSALGEMIQFETNLRLAERRAAPGSFDKIFSGHDLLTWSRRACLFDHPFLVPAQGVAERRSEVGGDLSLAACHEICTQNKLDFFALDVSRRDIGVPVARVIVPGLRGIWPRFAPGRLFDVPVKLGWVERPLSVAELNPTPILY
jgi:ribosomal protein S12 methylthiotransferase accessory factor